ncbi:polyprenol phosphomannose-dependent alpha 1,6 mannosyltransferase MptB [Micromonospora sp. WMMD1082]|uniref:polyprenol phosphomannose-dependent alpha 1,6 mannosyltransferase MptB n=1 Tax=Micromonospora sp. WMMD1082 TaxID=3016104 RepID=UPI002415CA35|nr:polyprenol phosphomannose-dependent alpha 1,6 mannosyltransferase MptB [Micromonospora sp. WMMD1082]MDG4796421.1 polyprenol phosphomannose-dependent alpha 1,6 mannosyltransferase MptB [Micromonospora sp. WMMD1082]
MRSASDIRSASTRERVVRYAGLAGALLLAVAGYLGGALPDATTTRVWHSADGPLTVVLWLAGTAVMVGAWWALRDGAPSTRWAYLTAGLWMLPLLVTAPLGSRDGYSYACQGWVYADGGDPYATGVAAAGCPWVSAVAPVWRDTPAPYGPLFVLLAALAVVLGGGLVGTLVLLRVLAVAGLLLAALCLPGLARAAGVPPRRAVWLVLACPLVGVHLVAGAHNDAVMLGLLLLGLLLLVRRPAAGLLLRAGLLLGAGALLGLAVSVKATAVVVLPFAALVAVRGRYTLPALLRDGGTLAVGVLGGLVVPSLLSGLGLGWLAGLGRSGDTEQWTSPPTAVGMVVDYAGELLGREPAAVPVTRLVGLVLLAALLVLLWWRTWSALRTSAPPEAGRRLALWGAGVALTVTVVLAPVFHPWYATWPLALLAVTATRTTWFVLPCAAATFLALPDGTNLARLVKAPGAVAMTLLVIVAVPWALRHHRHLTRPHPAPLTRPTDPPH